MVQERLATSDGWILHNGGPCPIPDAKGKEYKVIFGDGDRVTPLCDAIFHSHWQHKNKAKQITHYRLHKPTTSADDLLRQAGEALRPFAEFDEISNWIDVKRPTHTAAIVTCVEYVTRARAVLAAIDARMK